jgi:hypothetical protein
MKKLLLLTLLIVIQCGCSILRYNFELALNQIPKTAIVTKITNDYIEYNEYITNTANVNFLKTNIYRAYYYVDGKIYETKQIK